MTHPTNRSFRRSTLRVARSARTSTTSPTSRPCIARSSFGLRLIEPPNHDDIEITVAVERWVRGDGTDEADQTTTVAVSVLGDMLDLHPVEARRLARLLLAGADIVDGSAVTW